MPLCSVGPKTRVRLLPEYRHSGCTAFIFITRQIGEDILLKAAAAMNVIVSCPVINSSVNLKATKQKRCHRSVAETAFPQARKLAGNITAGNSIQCKFSCSVAS